MSQAPAKVRSFVAVPLPAEVRTAILGATQGLAAALPDIKWAHRAENLHITLKFLGQVDEALLARFASALAEALGSGAGFDIHLRGVGAFPSVRDARVIWVGVDDPSRRLTEVARIVDEVADRMAVGADAELGRREFRAHVTVGRTPRQPRRGIDASAALAPWSERAFGSASVNEVQLYESITGGDASTYVLRGTATLEGAIHGDGKDRDQGSN
jgi:2'-5' RNA ligase